MIYREGTSNRRLLQLTLFLYQLLLDLDVGPFCWQHHYSVDIHQVVWLIMSFPVWITCLLQCWILSLSTFPGGRTVRQDPEVWSRISTSPCVYQPTSIQAAHSPATEYLMEMWFMGWKYYCFSTHYSHVTRGSRRRKSPADQLFVQQLAQGNNQ